MEDDLEAAFVVGMDLNELEIEIEIEMMMIMGIFGEAHCFSFDAAARSWWLGTG